MFAAVAAFLLAQSACGGGSAPEVRIGATTELELLTPSEFVSTSQQLPDAVAELNRAQLAFIRDARVVSSSADEPLVAAGAVSRQAVDLGQLDLDLRGIAASAMNVGNLARGLAETMASQDGASDAAGQQATLYRGVADAGYALVIEAQNAREGLADGSMTVAAAQSTIADYGARLWNPAVGASSANPFLAQVTDPASVPTARPMSPEQQASLQGQLPPGASLTSWLAASAETLEKTLSVPPPTKAVEDPLSPTVRQGLTTVEAQVDADAARQVAAAALKGAPPEDDPDLVPGAPNDVSALMFSAMVAAGGEGSAPPTIPGGRATATTTGGGGGEPDVVSTILQFGPGGDPQATASTPVREANPAVTLTITGVKITKVEERPKDQTSTFEAEVFYEFDVGWTSTIVNPVFDMDCAGGNHFEVTTAGGTRHIQAKGLLILYPGAEDAYCYASRNGNTLGSASVRFLVGSAAGATARANLVETQSAELDLTLTADARATQEAEEGTRTPTATSEPTEAPSRTATPTREPAAGSFVFQSIANDGLVDTGQAITVLVGYSNQSGQSVPVQCKLTGPGAGGSHSFTVAEDAGSASESFSFPGQTAPGAYAINCSGGGDGIAAEVTVRGESPPGASPTAVEERPTATAAAAAPTATRTSVPPSATAVPPTRTRTPVPTNTSVPTAVPPTLTPTATLGPVFYESLFFPGDLPAMTTTLTYQVGVLYQFCFSGVVYVIENGVSVPKQAWELPMHVSGVAVGTSGCVNVQGNGGTITITCGHGESADPPGGYSITVYQLGPAP